MYWRYSLRRIVHGMMIYAAIIFIFSAIFNATMEQTVKARIEEEIHAEVSQKATMQPDDLSEYLAERRTFLYHLYHLDKPIWVRIVWRAVNTLTLNLGKSTLIKSSAGEQQVGTIIIEVLPRTLLLFTTAVAIDILLGLWLGLKKAQNVGGFMDRATSLATMTVYGMPSWWLGMLMIMLFAYVLKLFPSGSMHSTPPPTGIAYYLDILYHMALPVLTLVVIGFWGRALLIRNIVLGILQEDYIMAARARGITERKVLYGHVMRTASPPIATMAILSLLASVGGNLVFEGIFSWPGLGNLYWIAIEQNDIPVLMGCLSVTTALYIAGLVVLDLTYGYLDPRIKVGGKS
ncbi:ABC transporter permease subunit [candidate division KSB3 bacterium]|uniref:ABC transporter permease subunit n=1 Tax=candidate division KSB3 bacterium TaxID=2044937 RepID=A0A9D5JYH8_9BACT|nr:ABC transporter permease subunit [candidate division KSB3 bacterium]MBD3326301.1 ABC transporter permease subunit [candidate division KSB3 bacterium]